MAKLIVLRLVPDKPITGDQFTPYLEGGNKVLIIDAYDVSFGNQKGNRIGRAIHQPDVLTTTPLPAPAVFIPGQHTDIVQHRRPNAIPPPAIPDGTNFNWIMKAVATAVIVIDPPLLEYAEPDIILELRWGTVPATHDGPNDSQLISRFTIGYNVAVRDVALWPPADPDPRDPTLLVNAFQGIPAEDVAAYVPLPNPTKLNLNNTDASVTLPKDGSPPPFEELRAAVNRVVAKDPAVVGNPPVPLVDPPNLTPAQARHIAYEIAWNRHLEPLPAPPSTGDLENMYTSPDQTNDNARGKFEGSLITFSATHDAKAEALTKYVFSLSAAFAAMKRSQDADRAKLTFPVQIASTATAPPGAITEVSVALKN
jgi:hypothetical protein